MVIIFSLPCSQTRSLGKVGFECSLCGSWGTQRPGVWNIQAGIKRSCQIQYFHWIRITSLVITNNCFKHPYSSHYWLLNPPCSWIDKCPSVKPWKWWSGWCCKKYILVSIILTLNIVIIMINNEHMIIFFQYDLCTACTAWIGQCASVKQNNANGNLVKLVDKGNGNPTPILFIFCIGYLIIL